MKTTLSAPLDSASIPNDPEPANKSRHLQSELRGRSQEKICSFILEGVGFKLVLLIVFINLPPNLPDTIFILGIICCSLVYYRLSFHHY
jgi:hypothetical protein